jgi:hypothetical protein
MDGEARRQVVPIAYYQGNTRHVIGTATVIGDRIEAQIDVDLPPEIAARITEKVFASLSVKQVFDADTPLFPANAFEVNEPLAEKRLIDALLNIQIIEGEAQ